MIDSPTVLLEFDAKPWWRSKTIVFIAVSLVAKLALLVGVEIDAKAVTEIALLVLALIADIGGIWGRDRAQQPIRWRRPRPASGPVPAGAVPDGDGPEWLRGAPLEGVPAEHERDRGGYWAGDRGPFLDGD